MKLLCGVIICCSAVNRGEANYTWPNKKRGFANELQTNLFLNWSQVDEAQRENRETFRMLGKILYLKYSIWFTKTRKILGNRLTSVENALKNPGARGVVAQDLQSCKSFFHEFISLPDRICTVPAINDDTPDPSLTVQMCPGDSTKIPLGKPARTRNEGVQWFFHFYFIDFLV